MELLDFVNEFATDLSHLLKEMDDQIPKNCVQYLRKVTTDCVVECRVAIVPTAFVVGTDSVYSVRSSGILNFVILREIPQDFDSIMDNFCNEKKNYDFNVLFEYTKKKNEIGFWEVKFDISISKQSLNQSPK